MVDRRDFRRGVPSASVSNVTATEGSLTAFTISSAAAGIWFPVTYRTRTGTASSGTDYGEISGTVWFGPEDTQKTVSMATYSDLVREPDETFQIQVIGPSGVANIATGTIVDDPSNIPALSVSDVTVTEGSLATFAVSLSAPSRNVISVTYYTVAQSASAGADYGERLGNALVHAGRNRENGQRLHLHGLGPGSRRNVRVSHLGAARRVRFCRRDDRG